MCDFPHGLPFLFPKIPRPRSAERSFVRAVRLFGLHHDVLPKYYLAGHGICLSASASFSGHAQGGETAVFRLRACGMSVYQLLYQLYDRRVSFAVRFPLADYLQGQKVCGEFFPLLRVGRIALRRRLAAFFRAVFFVGTEILRDTEFTKFRPRYALSDRLSHRVFDAVFISLYAFAQGFQGREAPLYSLSADACAAFDRAGQ